MNIHEMDELITKVRNAQRRFAAFPQRKVDEIFKAAALAANDARIDLAKMANEETGMGIVEDKVIKNHFASEFIYNKYKDTPTCGIIEHDEAFGIQKIAEPIGVIAGIIPTTNPTSTTIFKSLISLKTRNGIIFSPHPRAAKCTVEAARIVLDAAVKAGAPAGIIGWIDEPSIELSNAIMSHDGIALILATGGPNMVHAAYSSGTPSIGVGPGNTPALIDEHSDVKMAVNSIILSKTFDNGMICASEQSVVVHKKVAKDVKKEFEKRGAYFVNAEERDKLRTVILDPERHTINPSIVGQSAATIATMAGFDVAPETKILIAEAEDVSETEPLAHEKLSPCLAMYSCANFNEGVDISRQLVELGGFGHTSVLYTSPTKRDRIDRFGEVVKTGRVLVNMPSSQGAIGDVYNFRLEPSLTLGCGSWGGNSVSENVGVKHLLNIKTIAERRENMLWLRMPSQMYHKYGCLPTALQELKNKKRCFIVTDGFLFNNGYVDTVTESLDAMGVEWTVFHDVQPDPTIATVRKGVSVLESFSPDVIIGFGGGSPMDAAKIMWLLYEHPELSFEDVAMRFMDIRKRVFEFPPLGEKASFVGIPTTSGTGSEVTPFSVITDDETGQKYPIADYALTPTMAIVDTQLVMNMPKALTAASGIDSVTHSLEAMASAMSTDYTNAMALESLRILFKYLPQAYDRGNQDVKAREKVHNASTMAGIAFANAFLGICHSLAHKLGAAFHITHGVANALLISHVIRYNAADSPTKQAAFPQYEYPSAKSRYARIAEYIGLGGRNDDDKVERLIAAIEDLKASLDLPKTIAAAGVREEAFLAEVDEMAEQAFDDQCTGSNPRYPLISELKEIYLKAFYGE